MSIHQFPKNLLDLSTEIRPLIRKLSVPISAGAGSPILTFIASRPGEGTTTVSHSFARAFQVDTGKKVLLIDGNAEPKGQGNGIVECVAAGADVTSAWSEVEGVCVASWAATAEGHVLSGRVIQDKTFWKSLQSHFDLIVIDAPSLLESADGIAFAQASSLTVLVVEAEVTRKEVVANLRDTLTAANATIAGVIMNNRKLYIPEKVYKRL